MSKFRDTVTLLRAPVVTNPYGNSGRDWSVATAMTVPASVQWDRGSEDVADENRLTTRMKLFLPAGSDLAATDRVRYRGKDYEVDGDVAPWRTYVFARLTRVTQEVG